MIFFPSTKINGNHLLNWLRDIWFMAGYKIGLWKSKSIPCTIFCAHVTLFPCTVVSLHMICEDLQRATTQQYKLFQSSYLTVLAFPGSYYQLILTFSEFEYQTILTFSGSYYKIMQNFSDKLNQTIFPI